MKTPLGRGIAAILLSAGMFASGFCMEADAATPEERPITLRTMGSLFFGGDVQTMENGVTFHGDHGYAQFYIPQNSRNLPLVMWHGIGQSGKTYESTPDGREGFQAILTRRDWPVFILDQPRRGRAGRTLAEAPKPVPPAGQESQVWGVFRFGHWLPPAGPTVFPNVQMPMDGYTLDQFFRQQTPDTGIEPATAEYVRNMGHTASRLFEQTGPGILITHSNSGKYGWATAMDKPDLVKAVVSYEPALYIFPEGEQLAEIPMGRREPVTWQAPRVPLDEFKRLTRMPILVIFGDNLATEPGEDFSDEVWRYAVLRGKQFVETVNKYGGDASLIFLTDLGMRGNTHIPFADLNNIQVADQLETWLREKGLDMRDKPYMGPSKKDIPLTVPVRQSR